MKEDTASGLDAEQRKRLADLDSMLEWHEEIKMAESPERESFDQLIELLRKHGLDWLTEEMFRDVALGKIAKRRITRSVRSDSEYQKIMLASSGFEEHRRQIEFLTSEPFSDRELLVRLLEAIRNTVVESAQMEMSILDTTLREVDFLATDAQPSVESELTSALVRSRVHDASEFRRMLSAVLVDVEGLK